MEIKTSISDGYELKELFSDANRDQYSMITYDGIVEFYESCYGNEAQDFDVIAWCFDLSEMTIDEVVNDYPDCENLVKEYIAGELAIDTDLIETVEYNESQEEFVFTAKNGNVINLEKACVDHEEVYEKVLEYVQNNTIVIGSDYSENIISFLAF